MARNDPQVNLRMPEALKSELEAAATKNNRSLTAEIVARLDASFGAGDDLVYKLTRIMEEREVRLLAEVKTNVQQLLRRGGKDESEKP